VTALASGSREELLVLDDAEEWSDPLRTPAWLAVTSGGASPEEVRALVSNLLPIAAGQGRFMFASRVATTSLEDGKEVFDWMHRSLTEGRADADEGWRAAAAAVGIDDARVTEVLSRPLAEAADLVAVVREYGFRSAHEGAAVSWALERRWPRLCGELADALVDHYGLTEDAVAHLRDQARREEAVARRCGALVRRYLEDPWQVFVGRRAAREVLWALTALLEAVEVA
jgi:pyrroloquinoline quinone (PQQ) biosynthesis protein C